MSQTEYGQFADAKTLRLWNCHRIGETLDAARPGDLLFYQQPSGDLPHHVMVFTGKGHFETIEQWVVYHTGPFAGTRGALRRVTTKELASHPEFRWRPLRSNPSFLGVFRWNILREGD